MKAIEYQALSSYLGMSPKAYVSRGLAIKRAVELGGTEVGGAPLTGGGSITSPTSLPTTKPKRGYSVIVRRGKYFNWKTNKFETKNLAHWEDYAR
jgi:hypothetical protein